MNRRFFLFFPLMMALCATLVMLLWNAIIVEILHVPRVHFWQAAGMLLLARIFFGRLPYGHFRRQRFYGPGAHYRRRWMKMSDEDRQKLKDEWKRRCTQRDSHR